MWIIFGESLMTCEKTNISPNQTIAVDSPTFACQKGIVEILDDDGEAAVVIGDLSLFDWAALAALASAEIERQVCEIDPDLEERLAANTRATEHVQRWMQRQREDEKARRLLPHTSVNSQQQEAGV